MTLPVICARQVVVAHLNSENCPREILRATSCMPVWQLSFSVVALCVWSTHGQIGVADTVS
jgi:hypothetical protein